MQVLPEVSYFLRYFDTVIYMNIGTARTNTPSSHPVRGHPATSALVSLSPFFRHRTAGLLRCFPFLHTAPDVPGSQFPLRPRAGNLRPLPGHPRRGFWFCCGGGWMNPPPLSEPPPPPLWDGDEGRQQQLPCYSNPKAST